jgi:hypothetical protein
MTGHNSLFSGNSFIIKIMADGKLDTLHKVQSINKDRGQYGAFAEIGAGQEVARWFFLAGGASGTVAKTISAYDMAVSDAIYGESSRYVSLGRLEQMLDHEYGLLHNRLAPSQGDSTRFFAYANTVAATSFSRHSEGLGWMGVRFQARPNGPANDIVLHVRLLDRSNLQQQEVIGLVGVNLIWGVMNLWENPEVLVRSLTDNIEPGRVEMDMVRFTGPDFEGVDNRLICLQLVQEGLSEAVLFDDLGEVVHPTEILYKRPILLERGSFRPITRTTLRMLELALKEFDKDPAVCGRVDEGHEVQVLFEMTLKNLTDKGGIDHQDFLERVDLLGAAESELGRDAKIVVSNYGEFHRLAGYLFRHTRAPLGVVLGIPTVREIFEECWYDDLEGGLLESFGRLFQNNLRLYAYPWRDPDKGVVTADSFRPEPHLEKLYEFLCHNGSIRPLQEEDEAHLDILSRDVLAKIRAGDSTWETMVPKTVATLIRARGLLGYSKCQGN